ncbi:hypothetical protein CAL7716_059070 [Calothrix sp. PCC 7716]|nr:hypothetical protein CAL7716_059070 [Calothrix sp. PCC 7716]
MCSTNVLKLLNKAKVEMTGLKNRILCIDDSQDSCELVDFVLNEAGYEVQLANSLQDGLGLMQTSSFSVCLLDMSLPDGSGIDLIPKLLSVDPLLQIIVCSGDARPEIYEEVTEAGAVAFFTKPIDFDLLVARVTSCLTPN